MTSRSSLFMFLRSRLRDESGVAMVVAAGVLLVIGILSAVVAAQSVTVNENANDDRSSKRALAAADAGFQMALARLNAAPVATCSNPSDAGYPDCGPFTNSSSGELELGDNAAYSYHISAVLDDANLANCAGKTVVGSPIATVPATTTDVVQRCITVTGTSRNVTRRIQVRVAGQSKFQLFPVGLTGRRSLCIAAPSSPTVQPITNCTVTAGGGTPNAAALSDVASNEYVVAPNIPLCGDIFALDEAYAQPDVNNSPTYDGKAWVIGGDCTGIWVPFTQPAGSPSEFNCAAGSCSPGRKRIDEPGFSPPPWDALFEGTDGDTGGENHNNDPGRGVAAVLPASCSVADVWNSATRELDLSADPNCTSASGGNAAANPMSIPAGTTWNLCRLNVGSKVVIRSLGVPPTTADLSDFSGSVTIHVDSPYRSGSGCGGASGGNPFRTGDDPGRIGWKPYSGSNCPSSPGFDECADGSLTVGQQPDNATGDPRSFLLFVYGNPDPPCQSGVTGLEGCSGGTVPQNLIDLRNGGELSFGLNAPWSLVQIRQSSGGAATSTACPTYSKPAGAPDLDICGAILARDLHVGNNFVFREDPFFRYLEIDIVNPVYYRANWRECTAQPTGTTPTAVRSGCL